MLNPEEKIILNHEDSQTDLQTVVTDESLVNIGCSTAEAEEIAAQKKLTVKSLKPAADENLLLESANTILLCGEINSLNESITFIDADEIILKDAKILQVGSDQKTSMLNIIVNRLTLIGQNSIAASTSGSSESFFNTVPQINLNVKSEVVALDEARLEIISMGANQIKSETK